MSLKISTICKRCDYIKIEVIDTTTIFLNNNKFGENEPSDRRRI